MHHVLKNEVAHAPQVGSAAPPPTCTARLAHGRKLQGIDPELDPNRLDLYDPRNPLNERRRKESKSRSKDTR
jgi:hypothetical protein